jgi:hypothetical protein
LLVAELCEVVPVEEELLYARTLLPEVAVVVVVPYWCQPLGEEVVSWGLVKVWNPSVGLWLLKGTTRYCDRSQKAFAEALSKYTDASIGNEGNHVDNFTRGGVNKGLVPLLGIVVLDLDDVGKDDVVGVFGKVLEGGRPVVVLATKGSLSLGNRILFRQLGGSSGDALCDWVSDWSSNSLWLLTGLDKAGTERDNLLALERDVGDSVSNRNVIDPLLEVLVGNDVGRVARLANERIGLDAELLLEESLSSLLVGGGETTLGERMNNTINAIGLEHGLGVVGLELSGLGANRAHTVGSLADRSIPKASGKSGINTENSVPRHTKEQQ